MTLSRAHTSATAADPATFLLFNERRVKHSQFCGVWLSVASIACTPDPRLTVTATLLQRYRNVTYSPVYKEKLTVSFEAHVPLFPSNLLKTGWGVLRNPANKQIIKQTVEQTNAYENITSGPDLLCSTVFHF